MTKGIICSLVSVFYMLCYVAPANGGTYINGSGILGVI